MTKAAFPIFAILPKPPSYSFMALNLRLRTLMGKYMALPL
jgi:hypothetical protein